MAANTPTVGTGLWTLVSGSGTISTPTSPASAITALAVGANVFAWTISNSPCANSVSQVTINVNDMPTLALAGLNQTICISTGSVSMAANTPTVGTGEWSLVSGGGTITNSLSPTSSITSLPVGTNIFAWTISNNPCAASVDYVTILVNDVPTIATAITNTTICVNSPTMAVTGNTPFVGTGVWTLVSGGGTITNSLSPSTSITGLPVGSNVFEWTISNSPCLSSVASITIDVDDMPTVSVAGPNVNLCTNTLTLNSNIPTVGTGIWSMISGTVTITTPTLNTTFLSGLGTGTTIVQWTISNGVCPASTSTLVINVNPFPTPADAGLDQTICASTTTLNGNVPFVGTGIWSVIAGSGVVTFTNVNNSPVTGLSLGNNIFMWTTGFGTCPNSTSTVSIFVDTNPTPAIAGPTQTLCVSNATLNANTLTVGTGVWSVITGTSTVATPTLNSSTVSGLGLGLNSFVWTTSNGVCPATTSTVDLLVDDFPSISIAGANQTICAPTTTLNSTIPAIGTGIWSVISGGSSVTSPTLNISSVTGLSTGTNSLVWTTSNGVCPVSTSTMNVFVDAFPTPSNAGPDQAFCLSTTTANLNAIIPPIGSGTWSVIAGGSAVTTTTLNSSFVSGLTTGTNSLVWTTANGVCPSSMDTMNIVLQLFPTPSNAGLDQMVCFNTTTLNANAPAIGNGVWSVFGGGSSVTTPTLNTSTVNGLATFTNTLVWTITNGTCPPSSDTVIINLLPPTPQAIADKDTTIYNTFISVSGNTVTGCVGTWEYVGGTFNITSPSSNTTGITGIKPGVNTIKWKLTDMCGSTEDEINITLIELEIPNAISPNGDGINDYLEIPISDAYTTVELKILNRWGSVVYENASYNNTWNGVNQNGDPLTDDTYFYVITLDKKVKTGYIMIKR